MFVYHIVLINKQTLQQYLTNFPELTMVSKKVWQIIKEEGSFKKASSIKIYSLSSKLTLSQPGGGGHIVPPPPQVHFLKYLRNALSYGLETF